MYIIQRLAESHPRLTLVNDQLGRPTWTRTFAEFMVHLIDVKAAYGIYHLLNDETTTGVDFTKAILKETSVEIVPVRSGEFPQKAYRPKHSLLNLEKAKATGLEIPSWREALRRFLMK